jgi:hypothetical protein
MEPCRRFFYSPSELFLAAGHSWVGIEATGLIAAGLATEGVGSTRSTTVRWDAGDGFPEPDRVRVRYIPQSRWNNVWLSVSGVSFTAIDAAVNAISDAAGWPQRF